MSFDDYEWIAQEELYDLEYDKKRAKVAKNRVGRNWLDRKHFNKKGVGRKKRLQER